MVCREKVNLVHLAQGQLLVLLWSHGPGCVNGVGGPARGHPPSTTSGSGGEKSARARFGISNFGVPERGGGRPYLGRRVAAGVGEQQRQCSWRSREERTLIEIAPFILTGDFSLRVSLDKNDIPVHRGLKPKSMPSLICSSKPRSTPNSL